MNEKGRVDGREGEREGGRVGGREGGTELQPGARGRHGGRDTSSMLIT